MENTKKELGQMSESVQVNFFTNKPYQGKNQIDLIEAKEKNGFKSYYWLTFLQARDLRLKIKKGSKSTLINKGYRENTKKDEQKGETITRSSFAGFARVFNLDQTEKLKK